MEGATRWDQIIGAANLTQGDCKSHTLGLDTLVAAPFARVPAREPIVFPDMDMGMDMGLGMLVSPI